MPAKWGGRQVCPKGHCEVVLETRTDSGGKVILELFYRCVKCKGTWPLNEVLLSPPSSSVSFRDPEPAAPIPE